MTLPLPCRSRTLTRDLDLRIRLPSVVDTANRKWEEEGSCPYGDECNFDHPDPSQDGKNVKPRPKYPCRFFEAGRCQKGGDCAFSHEGTQEQKPENTTTSTVHSIQELKGGIAARFMQRLWSFQDPKC